MVRLPRPPRRPRGPRSQRSRCLLCGAEHGGFGQVMSGGFNLCMDCWMKTMAPPRTIERALGGIDVVGGTVQGPDGTGTGRGRGGRVRGPGGTGRGGTAKDPGGTGRGGSAKHLPPTLEGCSEEEINQMIERLDEAIRQAIACMGMKAHPGNGTPAERARMQCKPVVTIENCFASFEWKT